MRILRGMKRDCPLAGTVTVAASLLLLSLTATAAPAAAAVTATELTARPQGAEPMTRERALAALRDAAEQGHRSSVTMLASLQDQERYPPQPALAVQPPGYHCHFLKAGLTWCHSGVDGAGQ